MPARVLRLAVLTVPAIAAGALGQGTMTFSWVTDDTGDHDGVIEPGESAVVTLWAHMNPRRVAFAGSIYDIAGDEGWQTRRSIDHRANLIDNLAVGPGELHADNSITGIEAFQFPPFFGDLTDPSNPLALYEIVWTPLDYGSWSVGFWSENHLNASVYIDDLGDAVEYDIVIEPGTFTVVPGPGVVGVMALTGLGSARRRLRALRVPSAACAFPPSCHSSSSSRQRSSSPATIFSDPKIATPSASMCPSSSLAMTW